MQFDIYGERLRSGFCEVHPWVAMEYPCSQCYAEHESNRMQKDQYDREMREQEERHYAELFAAECAPWFEVIEGGDDAAKAE